MNAGYAEYVKTLSNDELIEKLKYCGYDSYYKDLYRAVIAEIKRRMESRAKGMWRHYEGEIECSECHTRYYDEIMDLNGDDVPKYCPHCGAYMTNGNTKEAKP